RTDRNSLTLKDQVSERSIEVRASRALRLRDGGEQVLRGCSLVDECRRSRRKHVWTKIRIETAGQDDHFRRRYRAPDLFARRQAVDIRQMQVEQQNIRLKTFRFRG